MASIADPPSAAAYFRRSYSAVDGLWFVQVEEQFGFEAALDLDLAVWRVMPKIQARYLQNLTGQRADLAALALCLGQKLTWEDYSHSMALDEPTGLLEVAISACPWHQLLARSGRTHLAPRIGPLICAAEYAIWAAEFSDVQVLLSASVDPGICQGCSPGGVCTLSFRRERAAA